MGGGKKRERGREKKREKLDSGKEPKMDPVPASDSSIGGEAAPPRPKRTGQIKFPEKIPLGTGGKRLCLAFAKDVCARGEACAYGHDRKLTADELKAVYGC